MMRSRKILAILLVLVMALGLVACGAQNTNQQNESNGSAQGNNSETKTNTPPVDSSLGDDSPIIEGDSLYAKIGMTEAVMEMLESDEPWSLALSLNSRDEWNTIWLGFIEQLVVEKGGTFTYTSADGSLEKQLADIESLIAQEPDVILIKAIDGAAITGVVEQAMEAGIKVIDNEDQIPAECNLHLSINDYYMVGYMQGSALSDWLDENPDEEINFCYMAGSTTNTPAALRLQGILDGIAPNGDRCKMLAHLCHDWSVTKAMQLAEDWLTAYPEMNAIISANDETAVGAINALQGAGVELGSEPGQFLVVGADGMMPAMELIQDGVMYGTMFTPIIVDAEAEVSFAKLLALGKEMNHEKIVVGEAAMIWVNADNIDEQIEIKRAES